ncbi:MAG: hypothetical protein JWM27_1613 [Gemmatimonadetes bacterium]|nr:hypothetical protein [Gemmatimonadota bacterium]
MFVKVSVLACLTLPAALHAQRPVTARVPSAAAPSSVSREEMRSWMAELQQIGARLQAATERAMRSDPALRAAQDSLADEVRRSMEGADPGLERLAARARALAGEAQRASQTGDPARVGALMDEADDIQARFRAARRRALGRPQLAARVRAFETRLRMRLHAEEPQLDQLLARGSDLQERLQRAASLQKQMMRAAPPPQSHPE